MPASVPNIVASGSFVSQAAALGSTTLYTPSVAGLFRVNVYHQWTGSVGISPTFGWTDANGAKTYSDEQIQTGQTFMGSFNLWSAASDPITLAVTINGTPTWNLYYVIEQLA